MVAAATVAHDQVAIAAHVLKVATVAHALKATALVKVATVAHAQVATTAVVAASAAKSASF